MSKVITALYTLSDGKGTIYISKGKSYELYSQGKDNYIFDDTLKKMILNSETLKERFK
jgi:hypothetical protein